MKFTLCENTGFFLRMGLIGPSGSGKAQPLDAKVLTPTGWRRMGDICAGDRVINSQGQCSMVTGVFPQGDKPIFKVTFSDGSATECCDEHLWQTQSTLDRAALHRQVNLADREKRNARKRALYRKQNGIANDAPVARREKRPQSPRMGSIKPLSEIRREIKRGTKWNHWVPMLRPVEFDPVTLPLDPYLLGVLLGDGHIGERIVTLSSPDVQIQDAVRALLPEGVCMTQRGTSGIDFGLRRIAKSGANPLMGIMRHLGLVGHLSTEKFIPDAYKYNSVAARVALLQGLLDTDGYCGGKTIEYTTSSPRLADDFQFLVQSLGGTVTRSERIPQFTHKGERRTGAKNYRFYVCLPPNITPFRLERKAAAHMPRTKYMPRRAIVSVEPAGIKPCQCISVDAPDSLYVTDDCILTHNTFTALRLATELGYEKIAIIDTENRSARRYARTFGKRFLSLELDHYSPQDYIEAIYAAEAAGVDVLIIDSLSHAWMGRGGVLEMVDQSARRQSRGGSSSSFNGWREVTPEHNRLVEALVHARLHLIGTMRAKTEYIIEQDSRGKSVPRKVGLAPVQRDGLEYEFDVVGDMSPDHDLVITKSRCPALADQVVSKPGQLTAEVLRAWLDGVYAPDPPDEDENQNNAEPMLVRRPADDIAMVAPWLRKIQEAEEAGSEDRLDAVRVEMNKALTNRTKAQGEMLRRALDAARAAIHARQPVQPWSAGQGAMPADVAADQ